MDNRLYVGNLGRDVAVTTLQELFEPYGFVMDIQLLTAQKAGKAVRFALVTMATDASAREALHALNGTPVHGTNIKIEESRAEGQRSNHPWPEENS